MIHRYAALLDTTDGSGRPVGIALEFADVVVVHLPDAYGVPLVHQSEYRVLRPDLSEVLYQPGDAGYLEQVLVDLSWGFAIGEIGEVWRKREAVVDIKISGVTTVDDLERYD